VNWRNSSADLTRRASTWPSRDSRPNTMENSMQANCSRSSTKSDLRRPIGPLTRQLPWLGLPWPSSWSVCWSRRNASANPVLRRHCLWHLQLPLCWLRNNPRYIAQSRRHKIRPPSQMHLSLFISTSHEETPRRKGLEQYSKQHQRQILIRCQGQKLFFCK
jgi:hypothetical protein